MRCAVLGDPIAHSLSPVLHRAGYAAVGLDWTYDAVRVPAGTLSGFLASLDEGWRGLSLTMPLKREVLGLVATASERVRLAGAANTVLFDDDGPRLENTDVTGAAAAVRERHPGEVSRVVVLGGGATAASVGLAMCDLGAQEVRLLARSPDRAQAAAAAVASHPSRPRVDVGGLDEAGGRAGQGGPVDVLVSTIPATAQTPDLVRSWDAVPVVFEVLYDPWPTPLAVAAQRSGRVLVTGLDLLVHQAREQFELFTGKTAPLTAMRTAGEQALARR